MNRHWLAPVTAGWALLVFRAMAQTFSFSPFAGTAHFEAYGVANIAPFNAENIALAPNGDVYFADWIRHTVHKISASGVASLVAGAPNERGYADGAGAAARFNVPSRVAVDASGNVYVSDSGNRVIRRIAPDGNVSTHAGLAGANGFDDGAGSAARFSSLSWLVVDAADNLFALDHQSNLNGLVFGTAIRKITPQRVVSTLALVAVPSVTDPTADLLPPRALALDRTGNIFLTIGNSIQKITPVGAKTVLAGDPSQSGILDGVGAAARFNRPAGLAVDAAGNVFVADRYNHTLRRIAPDGSVTTIAGQVDSGLPIQDGAGGMAHFPGALALAFDASGNLFVLDDGGAIIRKGVPVTAVAPILTLPPRHSVSSGNVGARSGFTLKTAATGTAPIAFQWLKNGAAIPNATLTTFTIPSVSAADEGDYAVSVSNFAGSFTSSPVALRVYTPAFEAFTTRRAVTGGSFLWAIASGGGQMVAVGTGGKILTSVDGHEWTPRNSGTTEWLLGVTRSNSTYVVVGDHGTILTSADGINWAPAVASSTTQRLNNVAYGDGQFVAVGEGGVVVVSTDGRTWNAENSGVSTWLRGLVYVPRLPVPSGYGGDNGTGRFYAAGQDGVVLERTAIGWRAVELSEAPSRRDIEALASGPVGIGEDGSIVSMSIFYSFRPALSLDPGLRNAATHTWRRTESGLAARFRGLARGADAIFATGERGVIAAAQDISGPWSFIPSGTAANLVSGVFHGNSLFIVGENETILQSQALYYSRLINLSTRGYVGAGNDGMISGFVIAGSAPKTLLLRAAGPALGRFALDGVLPAPVLTLFDAAGHIIASNQGWETEANGPAVVDAALRVGAFPFASGSRDAALLVTLAPGAYTARVTGRDGTTGLALVEAYDVDLLASEGTRAINLSTRARVGASEKKLIAGFAINGAASRRVLIRAAGPALAAFGVPDFLPAPQIELYGRQGSLLQRAGAWAAEATADEIFAAGELAGAFRLSERSADAAIVATLLPGNYTVQVSGALETGGIAIVEIYDLP